MIGAPWLLMETDLALMFCPDVAFFVDYSQFRATTERFGGTRS